METFELRYFCAVARHENVHHASKELAVSPASLSKAVARLEAELGKRLFDRIKGRLRLSSHGRVLQMRAAEILRLEEATRAEIQGQSATIHARIAGPEILLLRFGTDLCRSIKRSNPNASIELQTTDEFRALEKLGTGDVQLAVVTSDVPKGFTVKRLAEVTFKVCVGRGHPLFRAASSQKPVPIASVLEHEFVCANYPVLGTISASQSMDGWRDDKFPRRIGIVTPSLRVIEEIVTQGDALTYLPDYHAEAMAVATITVTGCAYSCRQTVRLAAKKPGDAGWIAALFG